MPLTLAHIQAALAMPPLGERSDFDLNPEVRAQQLKIQKQHPAAVLCGLVEREGGLHVVLTRRAAHLNRHAGQIAFPGGEVDEVFETPLDFLMDPANRMRHRYDRQGVQRHYYAMPWGEYYIWGATAGMLKGLSDRLAALAAEGAR